MVKTIMELKRTYDISIDHFRAFMGRFLGKHGQRWEQPEDNILSIRHSKQYDEKYKSTWNIDLQHQADDNGHNKGIIGNATLLVVENPNNTIVVEFMDGKWFGVYGLKFAVSLPGRFSFPRGSELFDRVGNPIRSNRPAEWRDRNPIGDPLNTFAEKVFEELEAKGLVVDGDNKNDNDLRKGFPDDTTIAKKVYSLYVKYCEDWRADSGWEQGEYSNPTIKDFITYLAANDYQKYIRSERRLWSFIDWGKKGYLED